MNENLARQLSLLPDRLGQHLSLSLLALAIGIGLSIPLAVMAVRYRGVRWPALTAAGLIQTIPSLALLALMVPLLDALRGALGASFTAFGFWPALLALTLYSMLPILRNTVAGITGVDPSLTEAGRGLGMTPSQLLFRVELPLAAPVILAGIRTSTVWTVGIATLSTPVGQTSLGNYIFSGLQTRNWTAVLVGCASSAALALALDATLGLFESAAARRSRPRALVAGGLLAGFALFAALPLFGAGGLLGGSAPATFRVGAKTFTEQYILAEALAGHARGAGAKVETIEGLGSLIAFDALASGDLDAYVDYSGTLWANLLKRDDVRPAEEVISIVSEHVAERHGVELLGALGFENTYALAMRESHAEELGIVSARDLTRWASELTIGSDYEFFGRPEWRRLQATYGLTFSDRVSFDSAFMYEAVARGDVDVVTAFSSDGRIAAYRLRVLSDPDRAFPPYDAVLLLAPGTRERWPGVTEALEALVGRIDVETMREANRRVDLDKVDRATAARWLLSEALDERAPPPEGEPNTD